jgi:hypothetical protein
MTSTASTRARADLGDEIVPGVDAQGVGGGVQRIPEVVLAGGVAAPPLPYQIVLGVVPGVAQHDRRATRDGGPAAIRRRRLLAVAVAFAVADPGVARLAVIRQTRAALRLGAWQLASQQSPPTVLPSSHSSSPSSSPLPHTPQSATH